MEAVDVELGTMVEADRTSPAEEAFRVVNASIADEALKMMKRLEAPLPQPSPGSQGGAVASHR